MTVDFEIREARPPVLHLTKTSPAGDDCAYFDVSFV
jgi:hypothetical protein